MLFVPDVIFYHMAEKPANPARARQIVHKVLETGVVSFSRHAREEMGKDALEAADCVNVLRGGNFQPPELISGTWRYRVVTRQICVVIAIPDNETVRVVTAWRTT